MNQTRQADDDVTFLRALLSPLDPAAPGRAPTPAAEPITATRHRRSWAIAGVAAAAVTVILAATLPTVFSAGERPAPAAAPTARPNYDHVQWRDYEGTKPVDTVDWWWNGVDGRDRHVNAAGAVISDVVLLLGSTASAPITGRPTQAPPTLAATKGIQYTADDFPGTLPASADGFAAYLTSRIQNPAQAASLIVFQRHLDQQQTTALIALVTAGQPHTTDAATPSGAPVTLMDISDGAAGDDSTQLVLDPTHDRILGITYTDSPTGTRWWKLITTSELSPTTG